MKTITKNIDKILIGLIFLAGIIIIYNQFQLSSLNSELSGIGGTIPTGAGLVSASEVIPKGVPRIYGDELKIKYDDVSASNPNLADQTIALLSEYDRNIVLTGKNLERYISITTQISCEYCCSAKAIVFSKDDEDAMNEKIKQAISTGQITEEQAKKYRITAGDAACGCAHSYAMRGLAKYLLTKHSTEFTDDQILEELAKWKTLFFPGQMEAKATALKENGIEFFYINLGSNKYRDIEKGSSSGGMVGGC